MARTSKLLTEAVCTSAKEGLAKLGQKGTEAIKFRVIIAAYENGITEVARIFGISKTTLISWIKHVSDGSIERLNVQKGRGPKYIFNDEHRALIKQWMESNPQITVDQIQQRLVSEFDIKASRSTVHRAMKDLRFSYITPRPKHYKQSPKRCSGSKKKSDE